MSFTSLFLSMLLSIHHTSHHCLAFSFSSFASFLVSRTQVAHQDSHLEQDLGLMDAKINSEREGSFSLTGAPLDLSEGESFFVPVDSVNTIQDLTSNQLWVHNALSRVREIKRASRSKKLEDLSQKLVETDFRLLKKNLELILQKKAKDRASLIVQLIQRSKGNKEFHRYFFSVIQRAEAPELRSFRVLEVLIYETQNDPELQEKILTHGVSVAASEADYQRLLLALASHAKANERMQWSLFNLARVLGQSGLPILTRLASQSQQNLELQLEILEFLKKNLWLDTREGNQVLFNLANTSSGKPALQEMLLDIGRKQNSIESQLHILHGLAKSSAWKKDFQKLVYATVVQSWERGIERVKRGEIKTIKEEGIIARILAEFVKSKSAGRELKQEIFGKMNWFQDESDRTLLMEMFARSSSSSPQFQEKLLKGSISTLVSEANRGRVLEALASQSKKNSELQLELLEGLKELKIQKLISPILNQLIRQGVDNEVLQSRILKYIDSNFNQLDEVLLLSSLAMTSKQNITLQNWIIRRLEKLNENDQARVLVSLASVPQLEKEVREKIKELLETNHESTAKVGLTLLEAEL